MREECYLGSTNPRHLRLFSVSIHDAIITSCFSNNVSLSSIQIPIRHSLPEFQKTCKQTRNTRRRPNSYKSRLIALLGLLTTTLNPQFVYSLPGTQHTLVPGKSTDSSRQQSLSDTVINNAVNPTSLPTPVVAIGRNEQPAPTEQSAGNVDPSLPDIPYCFLCDTDSVPHLANTGANRIILNNPSLVKDFQVADGGVKGINGTPVSITGIGNYNFPLRSDSGLKHYINVPVVCVPSSPFCLFPPQLLHKLLQKEGFDVKHFQHDDKEYVFEYRAPNEKEWHCMTIPIDQRGMFTHWSNPGYSRFFSLASSYDPTWEHFPGHHSNNDDSHSDSSNSNSRETEGDAEGDVPEPVNIHFHNNPPNLMNMPPEDPAIQSIKNKQHRLSVLHERYGHLSFPKLQLMARAGLIPRDLANVTPPSCPGCAYGKAHRKPWRTKGKRNRRRIKPASLPGQVVSVDQLVSPTPGFVPTHRGTPTTTRYIGATVFVDHASDFTYVHLMTKMDAPATVEAKHAFERTCAKYGVTVKHYHADNGLFDTIKFRQAIERAGQSLTFCGVNAHHQNGKAERRIKDITQGARTALLHVQ